MSEFYQDLPLEAAQQIEQLSRLIFELRESRARLLRQYGVEDEAVTVYRCPGAWEMPAVARRILERGGFDAVIAVGAVIRGGTPHFDYVAGEAAKGVAQLGLTSKVPVVFGILTTDTVEQAIERSGAKAGNKGADAAMAALEMISLFRAIDGGA